MWRTDFSSQGDEAQRPLGAPTWARAGALKMSNFSLGGGRHKDRHFARRQPANLRFPASATA